MKKKNLGKCGLALLLTLLFLFSSASACAEQPAPAKVILDTDMEYLDDDAIAMFMLSQDALDPFDRFLRIVLFKAAKRRSQIAPRKGKTQLWSIE